MSGSVGRAAVRASALTVGSFAASQAIRFGGNLVLTRLLFPEVFGIVSLVTAFITGLWMFTDVGTGPAIIQNPRGDDPAFLDTAWTVQAVRGLVLWLLSCAIASPAAALYDQPVLAWLVPVAGLNAIVGSLESTAVQTERRHLRAGRIAAVDLVGQTIGIVATIALSAYWRSLSGGDDPRAAWAVVVGMLIGNIVRLVLTHTVLPGTRNRFRVDRGALGVLVTFGRWVLLSTLLTFLAGQLDRLLFGKLITLDQLGVYGIAAALAIMPPQVAQRLAGMVLFPAYSRVRERGDLGAAFHRGRLPVLLGGAALTTGVLACGPFLIEAVYDDRYLAARWIVRYLALAAWFQILDSTNGSVLLAKGDVARHAMNQGVKAVALSALLPIGFRLGGFEGALLGLVLSDVAKYASSAAAVVSRGMRSLPADLACTVAVLVSSGAAFEAGRVLARPSGSSWMGLLGATLATGTVWLAAGLWYLRRVRAGAPREPAAIAGSIVAANGRDP